ncbi:hypothetical protein AArcSl_2971 [Halalkaliarchaeum desulfuricum]|uniref:ABM domain-containing protein n=1 Tax=Halalkaliarchaeum desulfuricum TaxID=2055893 RepID=A0A343TNB0_9EURY|nr:hypothetical protein [Halalkaliarchaeum desulfuricum]AUX10582.1 hypothetical protein AArcSl_2971 [Halalkaliarchaeum desulfuricum]
MIVSIHEYELADDATPAEFEAAVDEAESRELFDLPGLTEYWFLMGIKGDRVDQYTAVWQYESREAWRELWGPVEDPKPKAEYPDPWLEWEDELLGPLLVADPDEIRFTSYDVLESSASSTLNC